MTDQSLLARITSSPRIQARSSAGQVSLVVRSHMLHIRWEPEGTDGHQDQIEADALRQKIEAGRQHMDEEYYQACLRYVSLKEQLARHKKAAEQKWQIFSADRAEAIRQLGAAHPNHYQVVSQKLHACGYAGWQVGRLIQYASYIQARGWQAFYPADADFLREKYEAAGVKPEEIDFLTAVTQA